MSTPVDPTWHQQREQEISRHFVALLNDRRFVVDTVVGRRPVAAFEQAVAESDGATAAKRAMIEAGSSDHALQRRLPTAPIIDVTLKAKHMIIFEKMFGHVRFQSLPPTEWLIRGEEPKPVTDKELRAALNAAPPPLGPNGRPARVPLTLVMFSSSGFTKEAQLMADRLSERTLILIEPNVVGGWTVYGTPETRAVLDLLDPEEEDGKRRRIRDAIADSEFDLSRSGVAAEKLATQTQLSLSKVEETFKAIAAERRGLVAKRMDGRLVLYRESTPPPTAASPLLPGGMRMPILDKFRSIFASGNDKKIAFLAERRTQIAQQQERVQDDMHALEQHEAGLKDQFKSNESAIIRKRVTTQLVQLRKEIDRKSQLLQMLNQQSNVVAAHLHSLELIQQGQGVKLPSGEELAEDAAKAEDVLAQVQADAELANELVGGASIRAGMNNEEAAMYDELMSELGPVDEAPTAARSDSDARPAQKTSSDANANRPMREAASGSTKRSEAQPG